MRAYMWTWRICMLSLMMGLISVPGVAVTPEEAVQKIVEEYLEAYEKAPAQGAAYLNEEPTLTVLKAHPHQTSSQFGQQLLGQNQVRRLAAATAMKELFMREEINAAVKQSPDVAAALQKRLVAAFQQNDPAMKDLVSKTWTLAFPDENLHAAVARSQPAIDYNTALFFVHSGGILLNPYTIKRNADGNFMLEDSGDSDTRFFVEAMYRNRYAWQNKALRNKWAMDYEMRLGIAGADNDPTGAVVSGAGDAYMEFSIGKLIPNLNNIPRAKSEGVKWVTNAELLIGIITDEGAQDLHFYYGLGPTVSVGIPLLDADAKDTGRLIEVLGGAYFGMTDKPQLVSGDTNEVKSKDGYPEFALEWSLIWRGDIRFPIGNNGFVTMGGRFTSNLEGEGINPWSVAIGYTIPVEVITDSVNKLFNQ